LLPDDRAAKSIVLDSGGLHAGAGVSCSSSISRSVALTDDPPAPAA